MTSTATRNESYRSLENLGPKQAEVLRVIREQGPINDYQIAKALEWPVNRVNPRRNELWQEGLIREAGTAWEPETKRNATLWVLESESVKIPPAPQPAQVETLGKRLLEADKAAKEAGMSGYWVELYRLVHIATSTEELDYAAQVITRYKVNKYPQYQAIKELGKRKRQELVGSL